MWWNPAALSKFQTNAGRRASSTSSRRRSSSATTARCRRPISRSAATAATPAATTRARTCTSSVPINPQWSFGLGVNAPFGLKTEYDDGWLGRYQALKSEIKTINVNPALSWQVTPNFAHRRRRRTSSSIKATFTSNVNYSRRAAPGRAGTAAGMGPLPAATVQRHRGPDARARLEVQTVTGDDARGAGTSACLGRRRRNIASARAIAPTIKYNVAGNVDFDNPPALPAVHAGRAGAGRRPASGAGQREAAATTAASRRTSSSRRSPTSRSSTSSTRSGT